MKRKWTFALAILLTVCLARPIPLFSQEDSSKQSQDGEPVYHVGNGVKPPRSTYQPMPEYDDASRKEKQQGVVVLSLIVTKVGGTRDIKIVQSLSPRLDKQAIKAVSQWRFEPATKDGTPVAVKISVETSFRLR